MPHSGRPPWCPARQHRYELVDRRGYRERGLPYSGTSSRRTAGPGKATQVGLACVDGGGLMGVDGGGLAGVDGGGLMGVDGGGLMT